MMKTDHIRTELSQEDGESWIDGLGQYLQVMMSCHGDRLALSMRRFQL